MPKKIVLLSCVATKLPKPAPAGKLYNSPLFKGSLEYANSLDPDDIVILSAKHYVLPLLPLINLDFVESFSREPDKRLPQAGYE